MSDFNANFRDIYKKLCSNDDDNCMGNDENGETNVCVFAHFASKYAYESDYDDSSSTSSTCSQELNLDDDLVTLNDLRQLIIISIISKVIRKTIAIYVSGSSKYVANLKDIIKLFNFDQQISIKEIKINVNKIKDALLNTKYKFIDNKNKDAIDLKQIINDYGLKFYDKNINILNFDYHEYLFKNVDCLRDFYESEALNAENIIHVCSNSDYIKWQKSHLLLKAFLNKPNLNTEKFIPVGSVKCDTDNINKIYREREADFEQIQKARFQDMTINESNTKTLTTSSIIFDLIKVSHSNDVKLVVNINDKTYDNSASFLLYNCARLSTLLNKFDRYVSQGKYSQLESIDQIDFTTAFKHDIENRICSNMLFKYQAYLNELRTTLINTRNSQEQLQLKLNTNKLCKFLFDSSNLFSNYYSKVKILEDPKFKHLYETMFARIYLIKQIYACFKQLLDLVNIETLDRL